MKQLFLFIIGLSMSLTSWTQPCLPNGITFNTQSQIDSFHISFPNCTIIEGEVIINGVNITNLYGLNAITSIGGALAIVINDSLTTLGGLENLLSIGADLTIFNNPVLNSLTGLAKLTSVGGNLVVYTNDNLPDLTGLDSLVCVGGDLQINTSNALINLNGLKSLTSIGGGLGLWDNPILSDLNALEGLTSINGSIELSNNNSLTTLKGLDNLMAESIHSLHITYNNHLSTCAIQSICDYLAIPYMLIEIHDNATGCSSEEEVDTACMSLSVDSGIAQELFSIYPNPASSGFTIESTKIQPVSNLSIMNLQGILILKCSIRDTRTLINVNNMLNGIYFVRITTLNTINNFKLIKN